MRGVILNPDELFYVLCGSSTLRALRIFPAELVIRLGEVSSKF